jgi:hypothetical protein
LCHIVLGDHAITQHMVPCITYCCLYKWLASVCCNTMIAPILADYLQASCLYLHSCLLCILTSMRMLSLHASNLLPEVTHLPDHDECQHDNEQDKGPIVGYHARYTAGEVHVKYSGAAASCADRRCLSFFPNAEQSLPEGVTERAHVVNRTSKNRFMLSKQRIVLRSCRMKERKTTPVGVNKQAQLQCVHCMLLPRCSRQMHFALNSHQSNSNNVCSLK